MSGSSRSSRDPSPSVSATRGWVAACHLGGVAQLVAIEILGAVGDPVAIGVLGDLARQRAVALVPVRQPVAVGVGVGREQGTRGRGQNEAGEHGDDQHAVDGSMTAHGARVSGVDDQGNLPMVPVAEDDGPVPGGNGPPTVSPGTPPGRAR